jgi:acyl carrier protein
MSDNIFHDTAVTRPNYGNDASPGLTDAIREVLAECGCLAPDAGTPADDDDLYGLGLTSQGSVHLMLALEERFGIEFPEHLLRRRTFSSVACIREAVAGLIDGPAAA